MATTLPQYRTRGYFNRAFDLRMVGREGKWPVRDFVLDLDQGRQKRLFQATGKALEVVQRLRPGDEVEVAWQMKGREIPGAEGRNGYFNLDEVFEISVL